MTKDVGKARQRYRNTPPIKEVIREFLARKKDGASVQEIYKYVQRFVAFTSKTPRNSVYSVLVRMQNVERVGPGKYKLTSRGN